MPLFIINKQLNKEEIDQCAQTYQHYIKFVVDISQNIAAAGTTMPFECEKFLLDKGAKQSDLWGGGIDLETKLVDYNSLINIRGNVNRSMEVIDPLIRNRIDEIIKNYFKILFT